MARQPTLVRWLYTSACSKGCWAMTSTYTVRDCTQGLPSCTCRPSFFLSCTSVANI